MATDMSSLQTYVDERTKRQLKYIGLVDGQSVSDIVRDLITRYVADWRDADGRPAPELP